MKKMLCAFALTVLTAGTAAADDGDGFYTRFDTGYSAGARRGVEKGVAVQTGFGWKKSVFRGEFTVEYTRNRTKNAFDAAGSSHTRLMSLAAMASGYADLFTVKGVTPYIGAGAGVSRNDLPDFVVDGRQFFGNTKYRLAWKAVAGVGINLPARLVLDMGFSYASLGRFSTKDNPRPPLRQEMNVRKFTAGLRYNF